MVGVSEKNFCPALNSHENVGNGHPLNESCLLIREGKQQKWGHSCKNFSPTFKSHEKDKNQPLKLKFLVRQQKNKTVAIKQLPLSFYVVKRYFNIDRRENNIFCGYLLFCDG